MKTLSLTSFIIIAFALLGRTAAAQQRPVGLYSARSITGFGCSPRYSNHAFLAQG